MHRHNIEPKSHKQWNLKSSRDRTLLLLLTTFNSSQKEIDIQLRGVQYAVSDPRRGGKKCSIDVLALKRHAAIKKNTVPKPLVSYC